jgi:hypothetical protein
MKKLLFILLLTIPFIGFGQGWEQHYNLSVYDKLESIKQTDDGGYIITGFISILEQDIILVKLNSLGDTLWTNRLIESKDQEGISVQQTSDGGYVICGVREDNQGNGDVWVVKTDSTGSLQWNVMFGDSLSYDYGNSIRQTLDGGYIITGELEDSLFIMKIDLYGVQQWERKYDFGSGRSIKQTSDGGYIVCGDNGGDHLTTGWGWGYGLPWIIKTNSNGVIVWDSVFQVTSDDRLYSIQQTIDGGYITSGRLKDTLTNEWDLWYLKVDSIGSLVFDKRLSYPMNSSEGRNIEQTNDGGYIITGCNGFNYSNVWLIKTNSLGDTLWTKKFGDPLRFNTGMSVEQTNDGGYIIGGYTEYNFGLNSGDMYVIKTDGNGNITSTFNIPTPSSNRKLEKVVDMLGREIKSQNNTPFIEIYDDGSTEKKLIIEK